MLELIAINNPPNVGWPNPKPLNKWIQKLNLLTFNIMVKSPLRVRNFITNYTRYVHDIENYGLSEHWPGSAQEIEHILDNKMDDCDGVAILSASILYSLSYINTGLALGYYGTDPEGSKTVGANHAYTLDLTYIEDPRIIECTGNDTIDVLPLLSDSHAYNTLMVATVDNVYVSGYWKEKYINEEKLVLQNISINNDHSITAV